MYYRFPPASFATTLKAYVRPYPDPLAVRAGGELWPDFSHQTDLFGWIWCRAADGREGWAPEAWMDMGERCVMTRDFNAIELTVDLGECVGILFSESGFVWCERQSGEHGWLPDAVLEFLVDVSPHRQ
jgi:hypothetical protein